MVVANVKDRVYPPSYVGECISVEDFFDEFELGTKLRAIIEDLMEELSERAEPDEPWLEKLSSLYEDRLPGKNTVERTIMVN